MSGSGSHRRTHTRRLRCAAALGVVLAGGTAGVAHADINGRVLDGSGLPVPGSSIRVTEQVGGGFASSATTGADGSYTISTASLSGDPPPYVVRAERFDSCRTTDQRRSAEVGGVVDGQVVDLTLDTFRVCASSSIPSGQPAPTGLVLPERNLVVGPPGAIVYLRVLAPTGSSGFQVRLADGTVIGGSDRADQIPVQAPGGSGYSGPLNLRYVVANVEVIEEIVQASFVAAARTTLPQDAAVDIALIVDESGSMASNDPGNQRRRAAEVVIDRAKTGDGVAAVGFDTSPQEIFPYRLIRSAADRNQLRGLARRLIGNGGGTNYDVGFEAAFAELTKPGIDLQRPKAAIFLTDGAHGGTYRNSHLRFAGNGSGRTWPVCVVQLSRSFNSSDVARLRRIARETGGAYFRAPTNTGLTNVYFKCLARITGQAQVIDRAVTQRGGTERHFTVNLRRRGKLPVREATFFVGWDRGIRSLRLREPGPRGRLITLARARRLPGLSVSTTPTSASITVRNPRLGRWRIWVRASRLRGRGATRLTVTTSSRQPTLTVPRTCAGRVATIVGTPGGDLIEGTPGPDVISTGSGNDRVFPDGRGQGAPPVVGANDIVCLGDGADIADASPGNDLIFGQDGRDSLNGGEGDDFLDGGADRDTLNGGEGDDQLRGRGGRDFFFGGPGNDTAVGGPSRDNFNGGDGNDFFDGRGGRDAIFGQGGNDTLRGGPGDDLTIRGGPGDDIIRGGPGNDNLLRGGPGNDNIDGGPGNDNIAAIQGSGFGGTNVLRGGPGADLVGGAGGDDLIFGGSGPDRLFGSGGNDTIFGQAGDDFLSGRNGNDVLDGGSGRDQLFGGSNNDRLDGGSGIDLLRGGPGNDRCRNGEDVAGC